ncbi:MAG: lipopolysaccharide biosynthesis protein [Chitinophagaceae bacterium]|nr:MAG: lipopolysaccharide biosynthesis protein [Chitinophagaceae bacterium]
MAESLKKKTLQGFIWVAAEKVGLYLIQFGIIMILARLLTPEDFGLVAMIMIFFAVTTVLMEGGLSSAIIRERTPKQEDINTVFTINVLLAVFFYIILFFAAPYIADFYGNPIIQSLIRIMGLTLVARALSLVHQAMLVHSLDFKKEFLRVLPAHLLSGALGIYLAYKGYGVFALAYKYLALSILSSLFLMFLSKQKVSLSLHKNSYNRLSSFGIHLTASKILSSIHSNLYKVLIGVFFSPATLGFLSQAQKLERLVSSNLMQVIRKVSYPSLAKLNDDPVKLKDAYRKIIKISSLIVIPGMVFMIVYAEPLISLAFGDQWLPAAPMLQIVCVGGMVFNLILIHQNLLKVLGRSRLYLNLEILQKANITLALVGGIWFDILTLISLIVLAQYVTTFFYGYYAGKYISYNIREQLSDLAKIFASSAVMGVVLFFLKGWLINNYNQNLIVILFSLIIAIIIFMAILRITVYREVINFLRFSQNK